MKFFKIEGELTLELADEVMKFLNETEGEKTIYISSHGGMVYAAEMIGDMLAQFSKEVTLVIGEYISSSAVDLVYDFSGKKRVLPQGTIAMIHFTNASVNIKGLLDESSIDALQVKTTNELNAQLLEKYHKYLTNKEIESLQLGKDVFLDSERSKQLLLNELPSMPSM